MIRVAVVGAGQMAQRVYLPVLWTCQDVELSVLVEPAEDRRQKVNRAFRFGRAVASLEEVSAGQADCAFLLTRPDARLGPLTRLFDLGLDVFCEKPISMDIGEAEQVAALAQERGRTLMIGFNRRFMPVYCKAKEFLAGRDVQLCRVQKQGGDLMGHTIHMIDVLRWFCGEPVEVRAAGDFDGDRETRSVAVIRFDSGALGIFQTSVHVGRRMEELEVHGKGFTIFVDAPDKAVLSENGREVTFRHGKDTWYMQAEEHLGFVAQVRHFLDAVQSRSTPESSIAEAIKSQRLAHEILTGMKESSPGR